MSATRIAAIFRVSAMARRQTPCKIAQVPPRDVAFGSRAMEPTAAAAQSLNSAFGRCVYPPRCRGATAICANAGFLVDLTFESALDCFLAHAQDVAGHAAIRTVKGWV